MTQCLLRSRLVRPLLAGAVSALLFGCGTPVHPPAEPAPPATFKEGAIWQKADPAARVADMAPLSQFWWTVYGDPVLDDLQQRLLAGNQNVRAAAAQMESARAALTASRAAFWPTASAGVTATRSRVPSVTSRGENPANTYSIDLVASWELDLWGRLAEGVRVAGARYQASADDLAALRLSSQAALTQTYLSMRATEADQDALARSVVAYTRAVDLTQARVDAGVAPPTDLLTAQTQLATTQAQAHELAAQRAQLEHALAVLIGVPPSLLTIAPTGRLPVLPAVPELLPSTLLQQRPDIAAAERRVAAAYSQIGATNAAWFPALTLNAAGGFRQSAVAGLLGVPNLYWAIGPTLAEAILDGGQRRLASDQARAAADEATAQYRQTVLTAFQEVEDNLVLADRLSSEVTAQRVAFGAAQKALEITREQYKAGTVSFLNVFIAQTVALSAERALVEVQGRQLLAVGVLLKNVGGRWEEAPTASAAPITQSSR